MLADEHGSLDDFDGNELAAILNGMPMQQADSTAEQAQEIVFDALILIAEETGKT